MRTLTVVIPCYNERGTIRELLGRVLAAPTPNWEKEVIVVDDASRDGTREILNEFQMRARIFFREKNGGKGSAVREAISHAHGSYMLIQDADLEYHPEEIQNLLAALDTGKAEVVYGSRLLAPRGRAGGFFPWLGMWFITKLINGLYRLNLTDAGTCYKLFPSEAAEDFLAGRFESEFLFTVALARRGYRFTEVPISYDARRLSEGKKIRYRDGIWTIVALITDRIKNGGKTRSGH